MGSMIPQNRNAVGRDRNRWPQGSPTMSPFDSAWAGERLDIKRQKKRVTRRVGNKVPPRCGLVSQDDLQRQQP